MKLMFKRLFLLVCLLVLNTDVFAQTDQVVPPLRKLNQQAFKVGETIKYRIHYGVINAGIAELKVGGIEEKNGRATYHVVGTGRSIGMAEVFFKTRDRYESWIDTEAMVPWEFIRDVNEGGFIIKRHIFFDQFKQTAIDYLLDKEKVFSIPKYAQDMLSTFYYARSLDVSNIKVGQTFPITMFLDHTNFDFKLKYLGKEVLKTKFGKIECLKFMPVVQKGRVFKEEEGMTLWVSNDSNKLPIRLQTELAVGSIKMDLIEYQNVKVPLTFKK